MSFQGQTLRDPRGEQQSASNIAYVCLSDCHFGAANSLLTNVNYGRLEVEPREASPVLEALVRCLEALVGRQTAKPVLVLNGDIFELALAHDNVAAMAFERFVELAFKECRLFARVVYIPGNHDHHLWETARETAYEQYITTAGQADPIRAPWHATRLRDDVTDQEKPVRSPMLRALFHRLGLDDVDVEVRYPNYGLVRDEGRKAVIFHHGHFAEPIYTAMTTMQRAIFPTSDKGPDVADWEGRNFAWIDFLWSTLGRSGDVGEDVGLIYDMFQDQTAVRLMTDNLLHEALPRILQGPKRLLRSPLHWLIRKEITAGVAKFERRNPAEVLSLATQRRLHEYIDGPLAGQLRYEHVRRFTTAADAPKAIEDLGTTALPEHTTFVFGHTHKPFQRTEKFDAYPNPVALYNSGGWVVDTITTDTRQGAAVILIDDDLNPASLHIYQQPPDDGSPGHLAVTAAGDDVDNPVIVALQHGIHPDDPPWKSLTVAITEELPKRHRALRELISNGMEALKRRRRETWPR